MAVCVCGAPIQWARTEDGQKIALDSVASVLGERRWALVTDSTPPTALRVTATATVAAYPEHAATCPRT